MASVCPYCTFKHIPGPCTVFDDLEELQFVVDEADDSHDNPEILQTLKKRLEELKQQEKEGNNKQKKRMRHQVLTSESEVEILEGKGKGKGKGKKRAKPKATHTQSAPRPDYALHPGGIEGFTGLYRDHPILDVDGLRMGNSQLKKDLGISTQKLQDEQTRANNLEQQLATLQAALDAERARANGFETQLQIALQNYTQGFAMVTQAQRKAALEDQRATEEANHCALAVERASDAEAALHLANLTIQELQSQLYTQQQQNAQLQSQINGQGQQNAPQEEIAAKDITEISESKPESESEHPKPPKTPVTGSQSQQPEDKDKQAPESYQGQTQIQPSSNKHCLLVLNFLLHNTNEHLINLHGLYGGDFHSVDTHLSPRGHVNADLNSWNTDLHEELERCNQNHVGSFTHVLVVIHSLGNNEDDQYGFEKVSSILGSSPVIKDFPEKQRLWVMISPSNYLLGIHYDHWKTLNKLFPLRIVFKIHSVSNWIERAEGYDLSIELHSWMATKALLWEHSDHYMSDRSKARGFESHVFIFGGRMIVALARTDPMKAPNAVVPYGDCPVCQTPDRWELVYPKEWHKYNKGPYMAPSMYKTLVPNKSSVVKPGLVQAGNSMGGLICEHNNIAYDVLRLGQKERKPPMSLEGFRGSRTMYSTIEGWITWTWPWSY